MLRIFVGISVSEGLRSGELRSVPIKDLMRSFDNQDGNSAKKLRLCLLQS